MAEITREEAKSQGVLLDTGERLFARRMKDGCEEIPMVLDHLMNEMSEQLGIRERDRDQYRDTLRLFILDLYFTHTVNPLGCVGYSRNTNDYSGGSYFSGLYLTFRITKSVTKFLSDNDYADTIKGCNARSADSGFSYSSRIRAREKLINLLHGYDVNLSMIALDQNLDKLNLKAKDDRGVKRDREFEETDQTRKMRAETHTINELLTKHAVLLALPDEAISSINKRLSQHYKKSRRKCVNFGRTAIWRSFSNDFEHGGRFYGGWWQNIPSEYRKFITIDDEPTIEFDYSGLHMNLLYAKKHLPLPTQDVYLIEGLDPNDKKARKVVKKLALAMINCESELTARKAVTREATRSRYSPENGVFEIPDNVRDLNEVIRKFRELNAPIAEYFCTSIGLKLQYEDSCLANKVMLKLAERNIVALPVHDSFIVKEKHKEILDLTMKESFREMFGQEIGIEADQTFWEELTAYKESVNIQDGMTGISTFSSLCERYPRTYSKEKYSIYFSFLKCYQ